MLRSALRFLVALAAAACLSTMVAASIVRLHFINVGHGDAILIEQDQAAIALIDAGSPDSAAVVLNYLRVRGHHALAHLFITHFHDDHIGGIPLLLDSMSIGRIHLAGIIDRGKFAKLLDGKLRSDAWAVDTLGAGDVPVQDSDLKIEVLSPPKEEAASRGADPNANSLVLLLQHDSVKVLLAADVDRAREAWLVRQYGPKLKSQAMKASHHASPGSNSARFLRAVDPDIVVVTVGPSKWGYPSPKTMERLHEFCPIVLRTDSVGTVVLQSDGKSIQVLTEAVNEK